MNSRSMIWQVRRELWENRSIYLAPLTVAGVIALASFGAVRHNLQPGKLAAHDELVAGVLMGTTLIVAIFYCLDALYGERRDRSVLFWKSMPVSDWTAVLSKMAVPMVILPVVTFVLAIATQLIMLLAASAFLAMKGQSAAALWSLPWLRMSSGMLYHLITVHSLYYAPIFGWLLLVSAWAKRLPFLWAFLPLAAIGVLEKIALNTTRFATMLGSRISGGMGSDPAKGSMTMLWPSHPLEFLTMPGLWIGLAIAAVCVAGAVRLRRYRDPI
ncbi:MAG: ABC transporter permease [Acidobacteria bacterium]|nr:ABC transporter permease [Acidobacteriota bacterium]MBV9068557.1 ABC transporter permease [Acidobacteriota bacterium]MBV9186705.1 ABC transporter permease [Acidobacteriota bacterium]